MAKKLAAKGLLLPRWNIVKGDKVQIMRGKEKGNQGVVQRVIRAENRLFVKGFNMNKKHVKARDDEGTTGGIMEREAPIHYSNVMLLDPTTITDDWPAIPAVPTRIFTGWDENGNKVRVAKKSGEIIPKPTFEPTLKYRTDGRKDTPQETAKKVTARRQGLRKLLEPEE